jgi:hypothetical protein
MSDVEAIATPGDGEPVSAPASVLLTQPLTAGGAECPTCGGGDSASPPSFVYAIGRIEARFPLLSVEKEFAQCTGRSDTRGMTDHATLHSVLSRTENRYLARQLCWVMSIGGLETYILMPRDPADLQLLIEALRPAPSRTDVDVVIGTRGQIAPPILCNGLVVPIVAFDQIYSFDVDTLLKEIPRPAEIAQEQFRAVTEEVFDRVSLLSDNAGATDGDRALNYLVMRYPAVYAAVADQHATNATLSAVDVLASPLSGTRRIVDVVFSFTNRATDVVEKRFARVDVTEEFPFLVTKMSPYLAR